MLLLLDSQGQIYTGDINKQTYSCSIHHLFRKSAETRAILTLQSIACRFSKSLRSSLCPSIPQSTVSQYWFQGKLVLTTNSIPLPRAGGDRIWQRDCYQAIYLYFACIATHARSLSVDLSWPVMVVAGCEAPRTRISGLARLGQAQASLQMGYLRTRPCRHVDLFVGNAESLMSLVVLYIDSL